MGGHVVREALTHIALRRLGATAGIASVFGCAAAVANAQGRSDSPPYPPPGRLVDVGGWRLHLNCTGETRPALPTVILEAGLGDFSVEWSLVQPGVARFARVCSYDRAGDGWSELGPHPRTLRQIVYELHTLLDRAGERPPYVLVGHSYGGWLVRLYQSTHPSDVAGMVLVEAGADNPWRLTGDGSLVRSSDLVTGRPIPPVKPSDPLRVSDIPEPALAQMRAGLAQASRRANEPPRNRLPVAAQRMRTWALGRVEHVAAAVNPVEHDELAALRAERAKTEYPLGDPPLVVITRGIPDEKGADGAAREEEHRQDHAAIAALSRRGKQVIAARSGHHVQLDEPGLVVSTIQQVVAAARTARGPSPPSDSARPTAAGFSFHRDAGVAQRTRDGSMCLTIVNADLAAGDTVLVVSVPREGPHGIAVGRIDGCRARPCAVPGDEWGSVSIEHASFYTVRLVRGALFGDPWIAVRTRAPLAVERGVVTGDLDGDGRPERFVRCTSQEGIHLRITTRIDRRDVERWHEYFYVPYDLEPDCQSP